MTATALLSRTHRTTRAVALAMTSAIATAAVVQPALAQSVQERHRADIDAAKILHLPALTTGIVAPPPTDKPAELTEYGVNIALKFTPASVNAPPPVVVRPNVVDPRSGELCGFRYIAAEHDLDPVFDYEDIFGFTLELPSDWGRLDDGATFMSNASPPSFYHYNTGAYVTVRRTLYETVADPDPWYPDQQRRVQAGQRILFTETNDIQDIVDGSYDPLISETFDLGINSLFWDAENKIDILFDVAFQPLWFVAEWKYSTKAAAKAKRARRFARNWGDPVSAWKRSIDGAFLRRMLGDTAELLTSIGLEVSANALENATDQQLTNWPTGTLSRDRQDIWVLDEVAPTINITAQPAPFEANMLGGERANRHYDELRELLQVSDNCGRPVAIDSEPRGLRFWPVDQTTTMQWCARDLGPASASGGRNESCVDIDVSVVDTRPPLLLPPPAVNLISSATSNVVDIGWAGVFDVADPDVAVMNDAPANFPIGRTPIIWTATDQSGNSTTRTQWINVKSNNTPPTAVDQAMVSALSFDETRIDLEAFETEAALDGRFDQLSFRISDTPDNGFFVAPLFPFFVEDFRTHRINPDGTYESYATISRDACQATGEQPDPGVVYRPYYVSVNDEGVMYVLDQYLTCIGSTGNRSITADARIARFVPDANGELEYVNQWDFQDRLPGLNEADLFIDYQGRLWAIPPTGRQIVVLGPDLQEEQRIEFNQLTKLDPRDGDVVEAFNDANLRPVSVAVTQDDILYVTTGAEVFSYDLTQRQPDNANLLLRLPPVVQYPDFNTVDTMTTEPWASYRKFLGQDYVDMTVDSSGDLYVSDEREHRVWKFQGVRLTDDRSLLEAPSFVGWLGLCESNLDPSVLACDTTQQVSLGFSCEDDLCGVQSPGGNGSGRGQFNGVRGITMSPQDVLYTTDTRNFRVQRFTTNGDFAGEAVSECQGSCFVLGDFGYVTNVAVNSNNFYLLDQDNDLTHIYETTPISDIDDQTLEQTQTAYVTYKSNDNFIGNDAFSFVAYDGLDISNEATVDISVSRNFRPPIATPGLTFTGVEDNDIPLTFSGLDRDGDSLDFEIDMPPENGTIARVGEQFVYTPNPNFFGTDQFTFVATDAPSSVPALRSEPELVEIVVAPVNDVPVLSAEPLDTQPFIFDTRIEALLRDVDLTDRHRVAIDWGDGQISDSNSDDISLSRDEGIVRILADHSFQQTTDAGSPGAITICASDAPTSVRLTCASSDVTATLVLPVDVELQVDLRVSIDDSLPKQPDPDVPDIQISDPLLDGGDTVTYFVEIQNFIPTTSDYRPSASNVRAEIRVPAEMTVQNVTSPSGSCSTSAQLIECSFGDVQPDAIAAVAITAAGSGSLVADADATLQVEAFALEPNVGEDNAGSWQTRLLLNGDLDADGDGVPNRDDAFPGDPNETTDSDSDGIGDNADIDDDNDSLPDAWENRFGLDRLDAADRSGDLDGDGVTNESEFALGTRPDIADSDRDGIDDASDNCPLTVNVHQFDVNSDGLGDRCDSRSFAGAVAVGDADGDGDDDYTLAVAASVNSTLAVTKSTASDFDIASFPLVNGSGRTKAALPLRISSGEVAVAAPFLFSDGRIAVRVTNAWNGNVVQEYTAFTRSFEFVDADVARADQGEDALVLLALADSGSIRANRRPASEDRNDGDETFYQGRRDVEPLGLAMASYDAAVVLAHSNGELIAEARDFASGAVVGKWAIPSVDWLSARIAGLDDGFVVLTTNTDGSSTVSRWSLTTTVPTLSFDVASGGLTATAMIATSGVGGLPVLRIAATTATGDVTVLSYDLTTGLETQRTPAIDDIRTPRALLAQDPLQYGVLASDASNAVTLELRDAATGSLVTTLTAESMSPPPPAPPPPPPPPPAPTPAPVPDGGGGGGSMGWLWIGGTGLLLARRRRRKRNDARVRLAVTAKAPPCD